MGGYTVLELDSRAGSIVNEDRIAAGLTSIGGLYKSDRQHLRVSTFQKCSLAISTLLSLQYFNRPERTQF